MMDMPIIRIQIEQLGHQLSAAIAVHEQEISRAVLEGVKQAATNIDFVTVARVQAEEAIKKAIFAYFTYGEGQIEIDKVIRQLAKGAQGAKP